MREIAIQALCDYKDWLMILYLAVMVIGGVQTIINNEG